MSWIILITLAALLLYALDREIYFYEATHLGPRVQGWLYDRWARKYDCRKAESQKHDPEMLAYPALEALQAVPAPFILDLATGTGRLPLSLLKETRFRGHIVAVDVSQGMLAQASQKLRPYAGQFTLLRVFDLPLPFPDSTFDMVSCLEALEVMPAMEPPLMEVFRVLRPGGYFLTSRGTEGSGRKSKVVSSVDFKSLLESKGFAAVEVTPWWEWFDRVTARKPGTATPSNDQSLIGSLKCPVCKEVNWAHENSRLICVKCSKPIVVHPDGILLL